MMTAPILGTLFKIIKVGGLRGAITLANFGLFALLSALYGPSLVGQYAAYLAFSMIGGSAISAGTPQMLMRRASITGNRRPMLASRLRAIYWGAWLYTATIGAIASFCIVYICKLNIDESIPLVISIGPVAYSCSMMAFEELRGLGKPEQSLIMEHTPTTLAPFITMASLWVLGSESHYLILYIIYTHIITAFLLSIFYAHGSFNNINFARTNIVLKATPKRDIAAVAAMRTLSSCSGHLAILIVSLTSTAEITGLITIVLKLTGLSSTYCAIVNSAFASKYGSAFRDRKKLRRISIETTYITSIGVTLLMAPMIIKPYFFLSLFSIDAGLNGSGLALQLVAGAFLIRGFSGTPDLLFLVTSNAIIEVCALIASLAMMVAIALIAPPTSLSLSFAIAASHILRFIFSAAGIAWVLREPRSDPSHRC